jgi:hypothetical protein
MYEEKKMPLSGFKSVTVPEEAYCKAKQLTNLGLEKSIGQAFENAIKEYMQKRQGLMERQKRNVTRLLFIASHHTFFNFVLTGLTCILN